MTEGCEIKRGYMKLHFKDNYEKWKDKYYDDRLIFCNIYRQLMKAIDEIEHVESYFIRVGFNKIFKEETLQMIDIQNRFLNR